MGGGLEKSGQVSGRDSCPTSRRLGSFVQDGKIPVIDEESVSAFARDFAGDSVVDEPFHC